MPIRLQNGLKTGPEATGESSQDGKRGTKQPSKLAASRLYSKLVSVSSNLPKVKIYSRFLIFKSRPNKGYQIPCFAKSVSPEVQVIHRRSVKHNQVCGIWPQLLQLNGGPNGPIKHNIRVKSDSAEQTVV